MSVSAALQGGAEHVMESCRPSTLTPRPSLFHGCGGAGASAGSGGGAGAGAGPRARARADAGAGAGACALRLFLAGRGGVIARARLAFIANLLFSNVMSFFALSTCDAIICAH